MYLYFNKKGILTTILKRNEVPRQNNVLNFKIAFDEDFNINNDKTVYISFKTARQKSFEVENTIAGNNVPYNEIFTKISENEMTFDLVEGKTYTIYEYNDTNKLATNFYGKTEILIVVKNTNGVELFQGKFNIFVEKTVGDANPNITLTQYEEIMRNFNEYTNQYNNFQKHIVDKLDENYVHVSKEQRTNILNHIDDNDENEKHITQKQKDEIFNHINDDDTKKHIDESARTNLYSHLKDKHYLKHITQSQKIAILNHIDDKDEDEKHVTQEQRERIDELKDEYIEKIASKYLDTQLEDVEEALDDLLFGDDSNTETKYFALKSDLDKVTVDFSSRLNELERKVNIFEDWTYQEKISYSNASNVPSNAMTKASVLKYGGNVTNIISKDFEGNVIEIKEIPASLQKEILDIYIDGNRNFVDLEGKKEYINCPSLDFVFFEWKELEYGVFYTSIADKKTSTALKILSDKYNFIGELENLDVDDLVNEEQYIILNTNNYDCFTKGNYFFIRNDDGLTLDELAEEIKTNIYYCTNDCIINDIEVSDDFGDIDVVPNGSIVFEKSSEENNFNVVSYFLSFEEEE